jgi:hypothetical protein
MTWTTTPSTDMHASFISARGGAAARRIPWELTFEQWSRIWAPHWHRKVLGERLVLARMWDQGGYALSNVNVVTIAENTREGYLLKRLRSLGQIV